MDDFKRLVVNEKDAAKKMQWVKENHDSKAYSFWKLKYDKLENELKVELTSHNMLTGFLDRCEFFRKYSYGVHCLVGEEGNYNIQGVWYWLSTDMLPCIDENPDCEYYKFVKLDPSKAEDWEEISKYFNLNTLSEEDLKKVVLDEQKLVAFKEYK